MTRLSIKLLPSSTSTTETRETVAAQFTQKIAAHNSSVEVNFTKVSFAEVSIRPLAKITRQSFLIAYKSILTPITYFLTAARSLLETNILPC